MSDAEWAVVRPLLPVPAWLEGRGGRPEGYCHRQLIDAVRYLTWEGVRWASLPGALSRLAGRLPLLPPLARQRPDQRT